MKNQIKGWRTRRANETNKKFLKLFILAFSIAGLIAIASPMPLNAPAMRFYPHLPISADKTNLTTVERIKMASRGYKYQDYLLRLAFCESRFDSHALNSNGEYGIDRGVFQINSKYHPEVSTEQAMSVEFATKWTMAMIDKGQQKQWSCDKIIRNIAKK